MDLEGYIAVFDSGVGGISVLKEITKLLPNENYVFYGDSLHAPYGEKSVEEVRRLTFNALDPLVKRGVKAIVVACNTATSIAIDYLRDQYSIPVIGVEPALKPAVMDRKKNILVMATANTLRLEKFSQLEKTYGEDVNVIPLACNGLAARIEKGRLDDQDLYDLLEELLSPYKGKIDGVVLGCTHYPLIKKQIAKVLGDVSFYDGGKGTARELKRRLEACHKLSGSTDKGNLIFLSSKNEEEEIALYRWFYSL